MEGLCNCIWKRKEWPTDWKKSVYVPIYKNGDKQECGNYRTIALISHASKVLLWIIQRRLEVILIPELPIEQAGFRRGRGIRDHIADLRWMMEKAREYQRDLFMCFIDFMKAFDCVDHERLCVILRDIGKPVHLIVLLRRQYTNQEATVRTEFGETDNIDIGKGMRQGCIFSPLLFHIYAENIMREALEEWERGISIGGRMVTNLKYAHHHIVSAMALSHRTYPSFISAISSRLGLSPKCVQLVMMWFRSRVAAPLGSRSFGSMLYLFRLLSVCSHCSCHFAIRASAGLHGRGWEVETKLFREGRRLFTGWW